MRSPFDDLGSVKPEEVEGTMQCHVCYINVGVGQYYKATKELVYTCPQGHVNTLEGYEFD